MSTDPNLPDIADEPGSSVSIYVPDTQNSDPNKYEYTFLRLGNPDVAHETALPPDPNEPGTPGSGDSSTYGEGLLLYTTGAYNAVMPPAPRFRPASTPSAATV